MILFGHAGFGDAMAGRLRGDLPRRWVLPGTLLPDLLDKPLRYALVSLTGLDRAQLPFIRGTRSFGHAWLAAALLWEDEGRGHGSQGGKPANDPRLADVELVGLHAAHEQEEDFVSYQFGTTLTFQF